MTPWVLEKRRFVPVARTLGDLVDDFRDLRLGGKWLEDADQVIVRRQKLCETPQIVSHGYCPFYDPDH